MNLDLTAFLTNLENLSVETRKKNAEASRTERLCDIIFRKILYLLSVWMTMQWKK